MQHVRDGCFVARGAMSLGMVVRSPRNYKSSKIVLWTLSWHVNLDMHLLQRLHRLFQPFFVPVVLCRVRGIRINLRRGGIQKCFSIILRDIRHLRNNESVQRLRALLQSRGPHCLADRDCLKRCGVCCEAHCGGAQFRTDAMPRT